MTINKKKSAIFILHQKDQLINHFEFKKNTDGESYFYEFPIRKEYKYMGITFTNKLKITQHIEILKDWSNKFYNQISKNIIEKFSPKLRIEIFKIFYQSKIFYGFPIICRSQKDLKCLEILYYKGIRKVTGLKKFVSLDNLCLASGILKFEYFFMLKLKSYQQQRRKLEENYQYPDFLKKILENIENSINLKFIDIPDLKYKEFIAKENENKIIKQTFGRDIYIENCSLPFKYGNINDQIMIEFVANLKPIILKKTMNKKKNKEIDDIATCNICNKKATPQHFINECEKFKKNREILEGLAVKYKELLRERSIICLSLLACETHLFFATTFSSGNCSLPTTFLKTESHAITTFFSGPVSSKVH